MLLPRFLTAFIGAPLLILSIHWGQFPFTVLVFGIAMLALHEFYTLLEEANWPVSKKTGLICGAFLSASIILFGTKIGWESGIKSELYFTPAVLTILFSVLTVGSFWDRERENAFAGIGMTWLGLFFIVWPLTHLVLVRDLKPDGELFTFFLFFVIWALDIGAYFGGMRFGKRKLAETISPKKTWEGVLVGSLFALSVSLICRFIFLRSIRISQAILLAGLIIVFSQISDLLESLFKRNVHVKDSGRLLPGHGGVLDRFDSFLLTAPLYYYALALLIKI